jgi:hypothetical protein
MATKNLFLLGGLALAAFLLLKKKPGETDQTNQSLPNIPNLPPAVIIPPAPQPAPVITPPVTGIVKTASRKQLTAIDIKAKADPTKVVYYPDYGIVTAGGLGYSTANPSAYLSKTSPILPNVTKSNPYIQNSSYFSLG